MQLSDVQIDKFVVLWKNATGADVSSEEAKQIAARLIQLYRILVHRIPSDRGLMQVGTIRKGVPLN